VQKYVAQLPFVSQRTADWVADGYPSAEIAEHWAERACGIACLKMVLDGYFQGSVSYEQPKFWELLEKGLKAKAYCDRGWIHKGLLDLAESYGLVGKCHRNITTDDLYAMVSGGSVCIASVTVGFRGGQQDENGKVIPKGGHLIIAHGIEMGRDSRNMICHHPSSHGSWNWPNRSVPLETWKSSFSGNAIEFAWPDT
jgi:hypothetical protein